MAPKNIKKMKSTSKKGTNTSPELPKQMEIGYAELVGYAEKILSSPVNTDFFTKRAHFFSAGEAAIQVTTPSGQVLEICGTFKCCACNKANKRCYLKTKKCVRCCIHPKCKNIKSPTKKMKSTSKKGNNTSPQLPKQMEIGELVGNAEKILSSPVNRDFSTKWAHFFSAGEVAIRVRTPSGQVREIFGKFKCCACNNANKRCYLQTAECVNCCIHPKCRQ